MSLAYFDTHCHLQDERFGADLDAVIDRALAAGVSHMACCGSQESDWASVLNLAKRRPCVIPLVGLHPWYVQAAGPDWLRHLERLAASESVGIGECGLDFALDDPDRELQEAAFTAQLRLAKEANRPVSIHCRRAWERLEAIVREHGIPEAGAVVHSFSGSAEVALDLQRLGLHLSFSCSLANPGNRRAAKAILAVSDERLLFETDAPDIPPRHLSGVTEDTLNEPANITLVAEAAARLRSMSADQVAHHAYTNSVAVFGSLMARERKDIP